MVFDVWSVFDDFAIGGGEDHAAFFAEEVVEDHCADDGSDGEADESDAKEKGVEDLTSAAEASDGDSCPE